MSEFRPRRIEAPCSLGRSVRRLVAAAMTAMAAVESAPAAVPYGAKWEGTLKQMDEDARVVPKETAAVHVFANGVDIGGFAKVLRRSTILNLTTNTEATVDVIEKLLFEKLGKDTPKDIPITLFDFHTHTRAGIEHVLREDAARQLSLKFLSLPPSLLDVRGFTGVRTVATALKERGWTRVRLQEGVKDVLAGAMWYMAKMEDLSPDERAQLHPIVRQVLAEQDARAKTLEGPRARLAEAQERAKLLQEDITGVHGWASLVSLRIMHGKHRERLKRALATLPPERQKKFTFHDKDAWADERWYLSDKIESGDKWGERAAEIILEGDPLREERLTKYRRYVALQEEKNRLLLEINGPPMTDAEDMRIRLKWAMRVLKLPPDTRDFTSLLFTPEYQELLAHWARLGVAVRFAPYALNEPPGAGALYRPQY